MYTVDTETDSLLYLTAKTMNSEKKKKRSIYIYNTNDNLGKVIKLSNILFSNCCFVASLRDLFRTLSNIYGGAFIKNK